MFGSLRVYELVLDLCGVHGVVFNEHEELLVVNAASLHDGHVVSLEVYQVHRVIDVLFEILRLL